MYFKTQLLCKFKFMRPYVLYFKLKIFYRENLYGFSLLFLNFTFSLKQKHMAIIFLKIKKTWLKVNNG